MQRKYKKEFKEMTSKYSKNDIIKLMAFCALMLSAVIWLLTAIGIRSYILVFIKDAVLLTAIALPAYSFAKSLSKTFVIIFWIVLLICIIALVFGSFSII